MLSSLYKYADLAYIGGGFGAGIHNTLEAAAFGLPVLFGPKYSRFKEACDLIAEEAGFSVATKNELQEIAAKLMKDADALNNAGQRAQLYVQQNIGATQKIVDHITSQTQL